MLTSPTLLALDFDGVICDGLQEYFQTTCRAYDRLWKPETLNSQHDIFANSFYQLRPVIETGWEMPVLLRSLVLGEPKSNILEDWPQVRDRLVETEKLNGKEITQIVDSVRDEWIESNLESWLKLHRFYPGIIAKIKQILQAEQTQVVIITTKEGRFAKKLLQQQGLNFSQTAIFGKEVKRPKPETLRQLIANPSYNTEKIWFVEDRLKTLELVAQQPDLNDIELYLADWGYNTETMRASLANNSTIHLLSLAGFASNFTNWRSRSKS
ncbi:HAD family hydrolase [Spirulina sp. 06S082]|uniref:HAD family hydrolase n=1 Tax=Spirulina sp. 06S082 TaxID=3110248 RepID=UPI002B2061A9|nr:HAD hydrolase-like protein [Spirulina sp. 06S082]MEA5469102.1 HAD hydrolase-like protein [Spirulina sp. 06S082]